MIIIKESTKDTYVTNRSVGNTSFEKSNVGRASTLDIFKLCNENSNAKSSAKIKIDIENDNSIPEVDSGFLLKDTDGNVCSFVFKNEAIQNNGESVELTQSSGSLLIGQKYEIVSLNNGEGGANTDFTLVGSEDNNIGTKFIATGSGEGTGTAKSDFIKLTNVGNRTAISAQIKNSINSINSFAQTGNILGNQTLNITSYSNTVGEVILKQNKKGSNGDTTINLFGNSNITKLDFKRTESSAIIIKFDIEKFKEDFVTANFANSPLSTETNLEAKIKLKDVSTGHTKPYGYTLDLFVLKKSFEEGLGKDVIHFTDLDKSNFIDLSESSSWQIPGYVSIEDDIYSNSEYKSSFTVEKGNEDVELDVTDWLFDFISEVNPNDHGFLIKISQLEEEDDNSYFVKRFGSRHLLNKNLIPTIEIKVKDDSINKIPKADKKRYLNTEEIFYLLNEKEGLLSDFVVPAGYTQELWVEYSNNNNLKSKGSITVDGDPANESTFTLVDANNNTVRFEFSTDNNNISGEIKSGTSNIEIGIQDVLGNNSQIASRISSVINLVTEFVQKNPDDENKKISKTLNITSSIDPDENSIIILRQDTKGSAGDTEITASAGSNLTAINFKRFEVIKPAITNFSNFKGETVLGIKKSLLDATSISRYDEFLQDEIKEKGFATFKLTWKYYNENKYIKSYDIKSETVKFCIPEYSENSYVEDRSIRVVTTIKNNDLYASDSIYDLDVFFYDTKKQYKVSKMKYDLPCSNLGDLYYNVIDEDSGSILVKGDIDFTKLFWNGKNYEFSFYVPKLFKNRRIRFEYFTSNNIYDSKFAIKEINQVFKVI